MNGETRTLLLDPLIDDNPITFQMLGLCSALAVTTSLLPALLMGAAVTSVLACGGAVVSALRNQIPDSIRIVVQMTIVATLVIVVDQILEAYAYQTSRQLSVFVGLIVTNCIVLARLETFAMKNAVFKSFLDGLGQGLGYSAALTTIAGLRELLSAGTLLGYPVLATRADGGWYYPNGFFASSPGVFVLIGLLIWVIRSWRTAQVEQPQFTIRHEPEPGR